MRILITGNMGYVGPGLVAHLRAVHPDATLLGYDSGFFAHCLTGADGLPERRLDAQHFGDVRDLPPHLLEGVDAVVHLAAVSNDPIGNRYEDVTMRINHEATVEVARRAREAGVRSFVMASSCSVYGAAEDGTPRDETSQVAPITAYARSKIASELDLEPLADDGFTVTCLRFATACGMSDRLRLDLVLNDFVAGAMASGRITVLSDGSPWRPLIHVSDMARAADWAIGRRLAHPVETWRRGSDRGAERLPEVQARSSSSRPPVRRPSRTWRRIRGEERKSGSRKPIRSSPSRMSTTARSRS
jgi:nucleoside-diphosphate-sugar epimerase